MAVETISLEKDAAEYERRSVPRDIAAMQASPIRDGRGVLARWPGDPEHLRRRLRPAENSVALCDDHRFAHQVRIDDVARRHVVCTEVFPQRGGNNFENASSPLRGALRLR